MILRSRKKRSRKARTRQTHVGPEEARIEAERRACLDSLAHFAKEAWHVVQPQFEYQHNWHIDVISQHLEALFFRRPATSGPTAGQPVRDLVINIPPRHMKSLLCSVFFPAWALANRAGEQFFYSSYAQHLSDDHALMTRELIESEWYQTRFGPTGNRAIDAENYVKIKGKKQVRLFTTDQGGARLASSVLGKTTGAGGDVLVADDPHNVTERESERKMARVITWWSRAMASRGNNPKTFCRLIIMQRVAEDDLAGWAINQGYATLIIPARYEGNKQIGCLGHEDPREEVGDPLWPGRFGDVELSKLEAELQEDAAGQLQQRPSPVGGRTFRVKALRTYSPIVRDTLLKPGNLDEMCQVWDLATKGRHSKRKRSFSVGAVWGRRGANAFLFDVWREQVGFAEQVEAIEMMASRWPNARPIYIEAKANGPSAADLLMHSVPGLMMVEPRGDKDKRARAASPFFKSGNIWVPDDAPWLAEWVKEHEYFPDGAFNDQVDTTSMVVDLFFIKSWSEPLPPEGGDLRMDGSPERLREIAEARARAQHRVRQRFASEDAPPVQMFTGRGYEPPD